MSEDKKKMYYYYGGKEKKAEQVKKAAEEGIAPYQRDFDRMMMRFQHEFDDFWGEPPRLKRWLQMRPGFPLVPYKMVMPSVDVEDRGKDYRVTAELPGFNKEDVSIEVDAASILLHAEKKQQEETKNKNYVRRERMSQTFYRRIDLPDEVRSDDAKASLHDGVLEVVLPKKEPKETKKLPIT